VVDLNEAQLRPCFRQNLSHGIADRAELAPAVGAQSSFRMRRHCTPLTSAQLLQYIGDLRV
jgi:hypothetical protein